MKNWIEVSERRLMENFRTAASVVEREAGTEAALLAVIKANGYGHGAPVCAQVLAQAGAEWLGVTDVEEGAAIRTALGAARQPRILIMCGQLAEDAAAIVRHSLTPVVWEISQMVALAGAAGAKPIAVHVEIDTGMSRQGLVVEKLAKLLHWIDAEPRIRLEGILTHFASAEVAGSEQTLAQRERFEAAVRLLSETGVKLDWLHAGNTSAIDNGADGGTLSWLRRMAESVGARVMVREGLGLYGYCLPLEGLVASDGDATRLRPKLHPVMTWKTRIIAISEVEAGVPVGYSGTFVAERRMRLALLPAGYADGLRRELSSSNERPGGWVMIGGRRARIVGRISMNLTTVDVTEIADAAVGDEVVLLGDGCTAEDHAALAGTIAYEIICGMRASAMLR